MVARPSELRQEAALAIQESNEAFQSRDIRRKFWARTLDLLQAILPTRLVLLKFARNVLVKRERASHSRQRGLSNQFQREKVVLNDATRAYEGIESRER